MASSNKRRKVEEMEDVDRNIQITLVLGAEYLRKVANVDAFACQILEKKHTSRLVRELSVKIPLDGLQHLKRVRSSNDKDGCLEILLGAAATIGGVSEAQIWRYLHDHDVNTDGLGAPHIVPVPQHAPLTREQYNESKQYWPSTFHEDKELARKLNGNSFSTKESSSIKQHMIEAVGDGQCATDEEVRSACVIVDPVADEIIAQSHDRRNEHPLHHAIMVAIEEVASRQRENETPLTSADPKSTDEIAQCEADDLSDKVESDSQAKSGPYLCTGYDVYLSQEPCVMCAMAMVHSRVNRVFYASPFTEGALGSMYRLHTQKGLNHHFDVFHVKFDTSGVKSDASNKQDEGVS